MKQETQPLLLDEIDSMTASNDGETVEAVASTREAAAHSGASLQFEPVLWAAADRLRGHIDSSEYKNTVLALIFLKYISDVFGERHKQLLTEVGQGADTENRDEYLTLQLRKSMLPKCRQVLKLGTRYCGNNS